MPPLSDLAPGYAPAPRWQQGGLPDLRGVDPAAGERVEWTKTADQIIDRIGRYRPRISRTGTLGRREPDPALRVRGQGLLAVRGVAGVDVAQDAQAGVVGQYPLDLRRRQGRPVRHRHLPGVQ
jgi:hypothetical protein